MLYFALLVGASVVVYEALQGVLYQQLILLLFQHDAFSHFLGREHVLDACHRLFLGSRLLSTVNVDGYTNEAFEYFLDSILHEEHHQYQAELAAVGIETGRRELQVAKATLVVGQQFLRVPLQPHLLNVVGIVLLHGKNRGYLAAQPTGIELVGLEVPYLNVDLRNDPALVPGEAQFIIQMEVLFKLAIDLHWLLLLIVVVELQLRLQ